jgi:hypothetical protein
MASFDISERAINVFTKKYRYMKTKMKLIVPIVTAFSILVFSQSCSKENENGSETKVSTYTSNKSHNMGQNCMSCHKQGGSGEGWFNVAGTVYDSLLTNTYPKATVNLYTGPNGTGTLKYTLQVDAKGNFYTTGNIDLTGGLYAAVQGTGTTKYMSASLTSGQCNSCHGVANDKIWTK